MYMYCTQISVCNACVRFIRWALSNNMVDTSVGLPAFRTACEALRFAAVAGAKSGLPSEFKDVVYYDQVAVMCNLWQNARVCIQEEHAFCRREAKREAKAKAREAKREAKAKAREEEAAAALQKAAAAQHNLLQSQTPAKFASFHDIYQLLHSHQDPPDCPDLRAVWATFRWVPELFDALKGGSKSYTEWLIKHAGHVDSSVEGIIASSSATPSEPWKRFVHDYHWIGRPNATPGRVSAVHLQQLDAAGVWVPAYDTGASGAAAASSSAVPKTTPLRRVIVQYTADNGDTELHFAGLLACVPGMTTSLAAAKDQTGASARTVHVWADGCDPQPAYIGDKLVQYVPLLLTMPRLHFLHKVAECFDISKRGILLTGVHGAGKSFMLTALTSILSVGGVCDVMFAPKSEKLAGVALSAVLGSAADGSGPLARQLRQGQLDLGLNFPYQGAWKTLLKKGEDQAAIEFIKCMGKGGVVPERNLDQPRVVIFDEVNELLEAVQYHLRMPTNNPAVVFWRAWLKWKTYGSKGCFRILAASPHGKREEVQSSDLGTLGEVRFELRPAPSDHLAAIMHCAPEYLMHNGDAIPAPLPLATAVQVCERLGGNARFISAFVRSLASTPSVNATLTLHKVLNTARSELVGRFTTCYDEAVRSKQYWNQPTLTQLAMLDASMVVRRDPTKETADVLAGSPALEALLHVAAEKFGRYISNPGQTIVGLMAGGDFELAITTFACLGSVASRMWTLSNMTAKDNAHVLEEKTASQAPGHGVLRYQPPAVDAASGAVATATIKFQSTCVMDIVAPHMERDSTALQPTLLLGGNVVRAAKRMLPATDSQSAHPLPPVRWVFQTVSSFPGIDIICLELVNGHMEVTFYEATVSTLREHSRKKSSTVQALVSDGIHAGQAHSVSVPVALRDIMAACGAMKKRAELLGENVIKLQAARKGQLDSIPAVHVAAGDDSPAGSAGTPESGTGNIGGEGDSADSIAEGTSIVNCLLATLGIPLIVRRHLEIQDIVAAERPNLVSVPHAASQSDGSAASDSTEHPSDASASGALTETTHSSGAKRAPAFTKKLAKLCLHVTESHELCDQLHGEHAWEAKGVMGYSFRFVYATSSFISANYSTDYVRLQADFVRAAYRNDLHEHR